MTLSRPKGTNSVIDLLERNHDPSRTALIGESGTFSYAELYQRSRRIAEVLRAAGAISDQTVGLCLERSPQLIFSVLGILEAGAAYVPIDPTYPADRIALMLEDAQPPVVITDRAHQHLVQRHQSESALDR
ncbi:MAG: AMP-binding protein [Flavobacteriales bacterium]|nr:AMP-binding protein [Flavobacteriales bacterium]